MSTLLQLPLDVPATIVCIDTLPELTRRLAAMGLRCGKQVVVLRRSWLGGPLQLRLGSTELMLRRVHAAEIQVQAAGGL